MFSNIELPAKYYLSHFKEMRDVLIEQYAFLFEENHKSFLSEFDLLSEDAQCLYLRMMNRKGRFFFISKLQYAEIESIPAAICELTSKKFVKTICKDDWNDFLQSVPKKYLNDLCMQEKLVLKKSSSRELLCGELSKIDIPVSVLETVLVQGKLDEISYLLFLYFGKLHENLALYTLRDLGIRKSGPQKKTFKVRFQNKDEALSQYFFSKIYHGHASGPVESWPAPLNAESKDMREAVLITMAEGRKLEGRLEDALSVLKFCECHPGREKYIRLLYQENRFDEAKEQLEKILSHPYSDIEYLFAEDFYARKFEGRKISRLTETLRNARKISIDESFFKHPEKGVEEWLKSQGIQSYHLENYLWNCLFGLLFWEELFESDKSSLFNEFERLPRDLLEKTFHQIHESEISEKLQLLTDKLAAIDVLLAKAQVKKDAVNGVFGWHESIPSMIEILLRYAEPQSLTFILRHMTEDFMNRSSGFPDLMVLENDKIKFYEIKAPGDSLKQHQLLQMIALQKAGFEVEVLQVEYSFNPEQLYVVVDIETTGGHLPYHRITELGAVKVQNGRVIEKFQTLVNPERHISKEIEQLTGISNEMVKTAPKFKEVSEAFQNFTKECIFAAHNVAFDYGFIQSEYGRLEQKFVRPYICTKAGMKKHYPGLESYGLKNLSLKFNINLVNHHRALADAEAAAELLFLINQKRSEGKEAL